MKAIIFLLICIAEIVVAWLYLPALGIALLLWAISGYFDSVKDTIAHHYDRSRLKPFYERFGIVAHDWRDWRPPSWVPWPLSEILQALHDMFDDVWHRSKIWHNVTHLCAICFVGLSIELTPLNIVLVFLLFTHNKGLVFHAFYNTILLKNN